MSERFDSIGKASELRMKRGERVAHMLPIGRGGRRVPEGVSAPLWRRLRVFSSWAAVAGKPLTVVSRPVDFDERSRVVRIAVVTQRWATEIGAYEEILRKGMEEASGERIARLDLTVEPGAFETAGKTVGVTGVEDTAAVMAAEDTAAVTAADMAPHDSERPPAGRGFLGPGPGPEEAGYHFV